MRGGALIPSCDPNSLVWEHLRRMGFDTSQVAHGHILQERHGNRLSRIQIGNSSYILKLFGDPLPPGRFNAMPSSEGLASQPSLCGETENGCSWRTFRKAIT